MNTSSGILKIWENCLFFLKKKLNEEDFCKWIKPLKPIFQNTIIYLCSPNKFIVNHVMENYYQLINNYIKSINKTLSIKIILNDKIFKNISHLPLTSLNKNFKFDNFVKGPSNAFPLDCAVKISQKPGTLYNPLLIYGGVGLGKTHLISAIGNYIILNQLKFKIIYTNPEKYVSELVKSLKNNSIDDFKNRYKNLDVLLLDDVQFFSGKEKTQEEFFHTFNHLIENKKQIVITCDKPITQLTGLSERLKSRFMSGLSVFIEPPDLQTRFDIIKMKISEFLNVVIEDDVIHFIAQSIKLNVRELEGALKRVIAHSNFTGREITIDFVKKTLSDLIKPFTKIITAEEIIRKTCDFFKIKQTDIFSKKRNSSIVVCRQLSMLLCKEFTNKSLPEIGKSFNGKDHSTVIYSCKQILKRINSDPIFKVKYIELKNLLIN